jgi:uncharacterized protein (DUF1778 family)
VRIGAERSSVVVRLDHSSKQYLAQAARLRHVSMSEYVGQVAIPQARREVADAKRGIIRLTADEQLQFVEALHAPVRLTRAQRKLGRIMRGED